jgi:enoyl-CoA hydratase/carnithine racemase
MTLAMDMRVAAAEAKIGFVFARRGVVPEACSSWFLPRIVGISKAAELVYTGRVFRAREEAHSGLFNYVLPQAEVLPKALSLAREIAENTAPVSVALSKAVSLHSSQSAHLIDSRCFRWARRQKNAEGVRLWKNVAPLQPEGFSRPAGLTWWKEKGLCTDGGQSRRRVREER